MRSLLAKEFNGQVVEPENDHERIARLFGSSKKEKVRRSRLLFADMVLANEGELRKAGLQSMTEVKFENSISRATAIANPRQIERTVAGSVFELDLIYELKTGALLEAYMMVGAVLAGASDEEVEAVEKIASDVGLAFQIRDDILDVTSTLETLGKPINSDDRNEKTTYVTIHGLEQASKDVEEISERAIEHLKALPYENEFLLELIKSLIYREK